MKGSSDISRQQPTTKAGKTPQTANSSQSNPNTNIMQIDLKDLKELINPVQSQPNHPMIGRRCLIRTYSAGVHIGDVISVINGTEVLLKNALRLWKWEGGGLSLSAVANNGINGGRLNKTGEIMLTNAIEFIPTSNKAELSYAGFIED